MGYLIGVDPGPTETAYAVVRADKTVHSAQKVDNEKFRLFLNRWLCQEQSAGGPVVAGVVVECIQSYGMPVGRETFETCYLIGRIQQICEEFEVPCYLYPRPEYVTAICGGKGSDALLRQALLLRFGSDKKDGPMYPLRGTDLRSAYAVAIYHTDKMGWTKEKESS